MNELVSIITAAYNAETFIEETIASVQKQTHTQWEMLIVDDASTDATLEKLEKIASQDHRIKYYSLTENSGPAKARNMAIQKAKGKYLAFLDADDIWFDFHLKNSIKAIQKTGIPFVFASYKRSDEELNFVYSDFIVPQKVTYTDILKTNSISCLTAFVNVEELGKLYMPNIKKRQDMGLWLQYLKKIPYAYGIQKPHAIYRIRKNSLSRDKKRLIKSQWYFYRKVENLSPFQSLYYLFWWMYLGYKKYKD